VYDEKSGGAVLLGFADANFVAKEPIGDSFDSRYAHETIQYRYRGHELHLREQAAVMTDIFVDVFIVFNETKGLGHRQRRDDIQGKVLNRLCEIHSAVGGVRGDVLPLDEANKLPYNVFDGILHVGVVFARVLALKTCQRHPPASCRDRETHSGRNFASHECMLLGICSPVVNVRCEKSEGVSQTNF